MRLRQRLTGLALMLAGMLSLAAVSWAWQHGWLQPVHPPPPPGLRPDLLPIISPLSCIYPFLVLGAVGLFVVGLKQFLSPQD